MRKADSTFTFRHCLLFILLSSCSWDLEGQYDPHRCKPLCGSGEICANGRCVSSDGPLKREDISVSPPSDTSIPKYDEQLAQDRNHETVDLPPRDVEFESNPVDVSTEAATVDAGHADSPQIADIAVVVDKSVPTDNPNPTDIPLTHDRPVPLDSSSSDKQKDSSHDIFLDKSPQDAPSAPDTTPHCGDGVKNTVTEQCDALDLGGNTCVSLGFSSGKLVCKTNCSFDTSSCVGCACKSGVCCGGCNYKSTSTVCKADASSQYVCIGTGCGNKVGIQYRDQYCSGSSSSCAGAYGSWKKAQAVKTCSTKEKCVSGSNSCSSASGCGCKCSSGDCCDSCNYKSTSTVCKTNASSQYVCIGTGCGNKVGVQYRDQYCSGGSSSCTGAYGSWKSAQAVKTCSSKEKCVSGSNSCTTSTGCCTCSSGTCCDGCNYKPKSTICQTDADSQYGCPWGTGCGSNVGKGYRDRYCSGSSASCDGSYGSWKNWAKVDTCSSSQICMPGKSTCTNSTSCCQCTSGSCCDGCKYRPSSYMCAPNQKVEFGCPWGTGCGKNVGSRYKDRYCSGSSASCDGSFGSWKSWLKAATCSQYNACVKGVASCYPSGTKDSYEQNDSLGSPYVFSGTFNACDSNKIIHGTYHHASDKDWYRWYVNASPLCVIDPGFEVTDYPNVPKTQFCVCISCFYGSPQFKYYKATGLWENNENSKTGCVCTGSASNDSNKIQVFSASCPGQATKSNMNILLKVWQQSGKCGGNHYNIKYHL